MYILNKALISYRSFLDQIESFFWVPFLDFILRIKFRHHSWVHFATSILESKNGANLQKFLLSKLHSKFFFQQTNMQIKMHL